MRAGRIIPAATIAAAGALLFALFMPVQHDVPSDAFVFEGIYYESDGMAEIRFEDPSKGTQSVKLEVLGMHETFHREYQSDEFTERVWFGATPEFGWAVNPIVLVIEHDMYGLISLKTEIRPEGQDAPPVIVGILDLSRGSIPAP